GVPSAATTVRAISICLIGKGQILSAAKNNNGSKMTKDTNVMPVRRNHFFIDGCTEKEVKS
ncbi:hypothetical protein, partial [Phytomonospora sp. NPDC050363]|uniref:hypothetical protein n=1 Tax=Phytomonospora sp. NPDC050363 TaxID=3155642 RepID=UPI0033D47476